MRWKVYTFRDKESLDLGTQANDCGTTQWAFLLSVVGPLASAKEFDFRGLAINHIVWIPAISGGSSPWFQQRLIETFWELRIAFKMLRQVKLRLTE